MLGMIPLTGAAAESGCTHSCGADCSYVEGAECRHEHDDTCGWDEDTQSGCTHDCADGTCGYIEAVPCDHVCDATCGGLTLGDSGKPAAVTILTPEDEYGDPTPLYLTEGVPVTEADLLAGVSAVDENGEALTVTVTGVDGLDLQNPAIPDGPPFPAIPYIITYQAAHPGDAEVTATVTREAFVTPGIAGIQPTAAAVSINLANPVPGVGDGWEINNNNTIWITDPGNIYTLTGNAGGAYRVYVGGGTPATGTFDITLDGVTINAISLNGAAFAIESGCIVNLKITGTNTLTSAAGFAGLRSAEGTTLTIGGAGSLTANSGLGSAGIGGNAASIGSNDNCNGGIITINGGTVIANGANGGAGIGGGASGGDFPGGDGGTVTINGGTVTATGGSGTGGGNSGGAGIGGGGGNTNSGGAGGTVIINGGTVTATGGDGYVSSGGINGGAGIGGGGSKDGQGGAAGIITINGGTVNATGGSASNGNAGANIGAGGGGTGGGEETTFKTITATAGAGGRISPSGSVQVSEGADATFTITPDSGYSIASVKVDNADNPTAVSSGSYTFANVTGTHTIAVAFAANPSLTLSASPASSLTLPGNVTLTATLTGAAGGNSGKTITFSVNSAQHTATTNASGVATYPFTSPAPGTYNFGASFAGDANNSAATATAINGYTVGLGTQVALTLNGLNNSYSYGAAAFGLSTGGGSGGGAVSYISSNPGVASVSGNTVTIHKAGTFTITATKAADSDYAAASVTSGTVTVSAATPNVSLDATGGSNITAPIVLTATVSKVGTGTIPTGTVTFSEGGTTLAANVALDASGVAAYTVNNPTAGSHTYTATYNGQTDYYNTNNANRTVGVGLADQSALSITGKPATITYGDSGFTLSTAGGDGGGAVTFSAPANNVLAVTSGGAVTITGAGTATVTATKAADVTYNQATATLDITVAPRDITNVTVSVIGDRVYTGSQLQPVFTVSDGTIAITSGDYTNTYGANIDAGTDGGSVTLTGQGNYFGTKPVTFDIEKRSLTGAVITLAAGPYVYAGSAVTPAVTSVVAGGVTVPASEYDVGYSSNTGVGTATVTVTAKAASANFTGGESTTFAIINHDPINPPAPGVPIDTASDATFAFNGDYDDLAEIKLNNHLLTQTQDGAKKDLSGYPGYAPILGHAKSGSVIVTLYKEFLKTLPNGVYSLTVSFSDGSGELEFEIQQPTVNPVSSSSSRDSGSSSSNAADTIAAPAFKWYTQSELEAAIQNGPPARTTYSGSAGVKAGLWKLFGQSPYMHDTTADGAVQVRVQFTNPSAITTDILLSGWVKGDAVNSIKGIFEKWFKNKVRVIHLEQQGAWGQPVQIAVRVDLSGMDTENLCFYSYDKKANSYKRIEKPAYWIDKNGYLRFTTEYAGEIIISEGPLDKK